MTWSLSLCLPSMMILSSKSRLSIKSPIGTVPYDVLLEIFIHCLPEDRFQIWQPNTRIAPILLCHICSSWRTVVLAAPSLWSQITYRLTTWDRVDCGGSWEFLDKEIAFLRWWKKNQGSKAPFLCLDFSIDVDSDPGIALAEGGMDFVVDYVSTAQHLEIDPSFWRQAQVMFDLGDCIAFPNLHTLVIYQSDYYMYNFFLPAQTVIGRASEHTPSVLRRLAIIDKGISFRNATIPVHWSTLTHLAITEACIPHDFWVSLTSAVPCLQWAYFSYNHQDSEIDKDNNPIERTLPQLSALFIVSGKTRSFSALFAGLHLPALNNLFLSCRVSLDTWWDHHGITDINTVLRSAPALKNLTLRRHGHPSPNEIEYATGKLAAVEDIAPVWSGTPHLAHLRLELRVTDIEVVEHLEAYTQRAFGSNNRWLDFDNPACPFKTITVIDGRWKTASIRKRVGNASNIDFHLMSEQFPDVANLWKEWR